ncbi:MAG: NAD(P)H-hydrate dehydratase [Thermoplasmata archaeon]
MNYLDVKHDDLNYEYLYGSTYNLMKNAGKAVAEKVRKILEEGKKICVICGTGNNAGDSIVAAEDLRSNYDVTVLIISELKTDLAKRSLEEYKGKVCSIDDIDSCLKADLLIDGIFGVGIAGRPRPPYDAIIKKINQSGRKVVSVDVPSGMGSDLCVRADYTVTFSGIKDGMDRKNSGEITVADIGITEDVAKYAGPGDLVYYPKADPSSHKGMNGTLAIVAGWEFFGSSVIAGLAAKHLGLDLVKIYVTDKNYEVVASYDPSIIVRKFEYGRSYFYDEVGNAKAVLLGPGMGISHDSIIAVKRIINSLTVPMVVDADALTIVSSHRDILKKHRIVITPHKGEFMKLTGMDATEENAKLFSKEYGIITVLKGQTDIITDGQITRYARGGNSRMTMGGTGDLLAGIIASFMAKGIDPMRSALMGTFLNKKAGEYAYIQKGYWYGIEDMISSIGQIMHQYTGL